METTVAFAPKISSGVDVIDDAWGGLYRGGSYLVYGRAATGRGLLTMMFAKTGAGMGERCLFISPDRPKDLMIQAASLNFNLREAHESGLVKLMRIPPMLNLDDAGDESISKAFSDLVSIIRQHRPDRLVINDFIPFVQFQSFERFRAAFVQMLEQIDSIDTTTALVMAEPANQQSRKVIDFMRNQITGAVHIELADVGSESTLRRLTLLPNIGHITSHVVEFWDLQEVVVDPELHASASPRMLPGRAGEKPIISQDAGRRRYRFALDARLEEGMAPKPYEEPFPPHSQRAPGPDPNRVQTAMSYDDPEAAGKSVLSATSEQDEFDTREPPAAVDVPVTKRARVMRPYRLGVEPEPTPESINPPRPPGAVRSRFIRPIPLGRTQGANPGQRHVEPEQPRRSAAPGGTQRQSYGSELEDAGEAARSEPTDVSEEAGYQAQLPYRDEPVYRSMSAEQADSSDVALQSRHDEFTYSGTADEHQTSTIVERHDRTAAERHEPAATEERAHAATEQHDHAATEERAHAATEQRDHAATELPQSPLTEQPESRLLEQPEAPVIKQPASPVTEQRKQAPTEEPEPVSTALPESVAMEGAESASAAVREFARAMPSAATRISHSDRDAFRSRLQQHFLRRDVNDTPFMLIAMRMDRSEEHTARPFDFEFILDLVSELLRGEDDMVVDLDRERLIVLLAQSRHDDARNFFVRLKNRLREEAPKQADHLLHSVSAFYLSDGQPFKNAEEFLTYALDED